MAKLMGKGGTLAKNYIGGQIRNIGEVVEVTILPRPDKIPTLIIGEKGSVDPRPCVLISFNTPHGALIQKPTISGGFSIR